MTQISWTAVAKTFKFLRISRMGMRARMIIHLVLLLIMLFGYGKSAFVNISVPKPEVDLGEDIKIEVIQISPNTSSQKFDRLDCGIMLPGDSSYKIIVAQYDKYSLSFKSPSHGIPKSFRDRVSYVGRMSFVIHRIRFEDKFMKVVCILNYKNGSLTSHVESQTYEVKTVYINPSFHSNSTSSGIVKIAYGVKTGVRCVVTSWPTSKIHWESSIIRSDFNITNSTSETNGVFATESTFMLVSPSFHYDGKNTTCVAIPKHGNTIRREFTLSYINVMPTFHINTTPQGIVKMVSGKKTKIQCIVVSWPPSVLSWEINFAKSEYMFKDLKSESNGAALVKKTLILLSPSSRLDGQKVTCIVTSNNGTALRREFTLSFASGITTNSPPPVTADNSSPPATTDKDMNNKKKNSNAAGKSYMSAIIALSVFLSSVVNVA